MEIVIAREISELIVSKGYKEDTFFFYAKRIKTGTWHLCSIIQYEDNGSTSSYYSHTANTIFSQYEFEEDTLPAPTLQEIPLPPRCVIKKRFVKLNELEPSGKWFVCDKVSFVTQPNAENNFDNELTARAMSFAWWADYLKYIEQENAK